MIAGPRGHWTEERVVEALADWVRRLGTYPTKASLRRHGQGDLASARDRLWGGRDVALRAAVAGSAGTSVRPARAPNGSFDTVEQVGGHCARSRRRSAECRRWPSQ